MKARRFFPLMAAMLGCMPEGDSTPSADSGTAPDGSALVADAAPGGTPDAGDAPMLHGSPPLSPMTAPEFTVLNRDGTTRTRANLVGHRTVMWFYPAAFTAG